MSKATITYTPVVGLNIWRLRRQRRLQSKEVAKRLGISAHYMSRLENDRETPSHAVMLKLAEVLGVEYVAGTAPPHHFFKEYGNE